MGKKKAQTSKSKKAKKTIQQVLPNLLIVKEKNLKPLDYKKD